MHLTPEILDQSPEPSCFDRNMYNMRLVNKMIRVMNREGGIGLSANQVGVRQRVFVMKYQGEEIACWNPEIISRSDGMVSFDEGCLSFPGEFCNIARPADIEVLYYNCVGKPFQRRMSGIESRCFQHELDHLNGITMWQRHKEQNAK